MSQHGFRLAGLALAIVAIWQTCGSHARAFQRLETVRQYGKTVLQPPHTGGDQDFNGNGLRVGVQAKFVVINGDLYRQVVMTAIERLSDFTQASGSSPLELIYQAPPGYRVVSVPEPTRQLVSATITGHKIPKYTTDLGTVEIFGDHRGNDAGVYTQATVRFNGSIRVVIAQETTPRDTKVSIPLPEIVNLVPGPNRGDLEFSGNGPNVKVVRSFTYTANQVKMSLSMQATETKSDWTTGSREKEWIVYIAPRGYEISSIANEANLRRTELAYEDKDHSAEKFRVPLGELRVFGDRRGSDILFYTRLEAHFNRPLVVNLKPANATTLRASRARR